MIRVQFLNAKVKMMLLNHHSVEHSNAQLIVDCRHRAGITHKTKGMGFVRSYECTGPGKAAGSGAILIKLIWKVFMRLVSIDCCSALG